MSASGFAITDTGLAYPRIVDTNEFATISTTLATAITATGTSQSINVASTAGMVVDMLVGCDVGSSQEIIQIVAIVDATNFTGVPTKLHSLNALVGQKAQRQLTTIASPSVYANQAEVKAGSVVPVVADMALVVSAGPNSTLPSASTGTPTNVTGAISNTVLLSANAARKGTYIVNDGTSQILYIAYGYTASLTAYTLALQPGAIQTPDPVCFTGAINGIWSGVGATARITELTN